MKRIPHPKLLFAAVLVLAVAVSAGFAYRAGWLAGEGEVDSIYWQKNITWSFRLEKGSPFVYANHPEPSELPHGEIAGTVTVCDNPLLLGQTAYYPEGATGRGTVLVEWLPFGWCSFTCDKLEIPRVGLGAPPDAVFDGFGLPESLQSGSLSGGDAPAASFSAESLAELIDLLSATENQGLTGLLADTNAQDDPAAAKTGTRFVTLRNTDGYYLTIEYYPRLGGVALWDGYYPIPVERIPALEALLYPEA